jgi:hypothetical protein
MKGLVVSRSFRVATRAVIVLSTALTALTACGDDEPVGPVQGCTDFVDAWCNKRAECSLPSDRGRVGEDCRFAIGLDVDCSKVKGLGPTYEACISSIVNLPCTSAEGLALPQSCKGILRQ